jgi:hypothetical protein
MGTLCKICWAQAGLCLLLGKVGATEGSTQRRVMLCALIHTHRPYRPQGVQDKLGSGGSG